MLNLFLYLWVYIYILERIQRKATKYIINDYRNDYNLRLLTLNMLPLMYWFELQDLLYFTDTKSGYNGILKHVFTKLTLK